MKFFFNYILFLYVICMRSTINQTISHQLEKFPDFLYMYLWNFTKSFNFLHIFPFNLINSISNNFVRPLVQWMLYQEMA